MRRRHWAVLLSGVALGHGVALFGLNTSMAQLGGMKLMNEPLFARTLDVQDLSAQNAKTAAAASVSPPPKAPPAPPLQRPAPVPLDAASVPKPEPESRSEPEAKTEPKAEVVSAPAADRPASASAAGVATGDAASPSLGATAGNGLGTDTLGAWPTDSRISYAVSGYYRGELPPGKGNVTWLRQDSHYQVRMDVDLTLAHVSMTSQGEIREGEMWPTAYEEQLPNRRRKLELGELVLRFEDGKSIERPPGVVDIVGQFVALTQRYQSGKTALRAGDVVKVPLARPGGFDEWEYDVAAEPALGLRLNESYREFEAFHLKPRPLKNPRGPITTEFWLVPALGYYPGRVRINLGEGNFLMLDVQRIESK